MIEFADDDAMSHVNRDLLAAFNNARLQVENAREALEVEREECVRRIVEIDQALGDGRTRTSRSKMATTSPATKRKPGRPKKIKIDTEAT